MAGRVLPSVLKTLTKVQLCPGINRMVGGHAIRIPALPLVNWNLIQLRQFSRCARLYKPICTVFTNQPDSSVSNKFTEDLSVKLTQVLNKPIDRIYVTLLTDQKMCTKGDSRTPTVVMELFSVGSFDEERNPGITKKLFDFLVPELKVDPDRIIIHYHELDGKFLGRILK